MDMELLQATIDIVFKGNMLYLSPFLFILMIILFSDRLIDLVYSAIGKGTNGRRNRY